MQAPPARDQPAFPIQSPPFPGPPRSRPQRLLLMTTDVRKAKPGPEGLPLAAARSRPSSSLPSSGQRLPTSRTGSAEERGRKNQSRLPPSAPRQQRDGHDPCGRLLLRDEQCQVAGRRSAPKSRAGSEGKVWYRDPGLTSGRAVPKSSSGGAGASPTTQSHLSLLKIRLQGPRAPPLGSPGSEPRLAVTGGDG